MVGHAHEDVDQHFANLSMLLQQGQHRLHTPYDFQKVLATYLGMDHVRPLEANSEVVLLNRVRDWILGSD